MFSAREKNRIRKSKAEGLNSENPDSVLSGGECIAAAPDEVPRKAKSFAAGTGFYKMMWIFMIACILGYIVEMLFCMIKYSKIESRQGVIYGPFCQVYGFGAVIMILVLRPFEKLNPVLIFLFSAVLGGAFEQICSIVQEKIFGTVSWDYSNSGLSLFGGRTSLKYMLYWGILGLVLIRVLYPLLSRIIEHIPNVPGKIVTWVFLVFMTVNLALSGSAVYRWAQRERGIPASNSYEEFIDNNYPQEYMQKVYPNMVIKKR